MPAPCRPLLLALLLLLATPLAASAQARAVEAALTPDGLRVLLECPAVPPSLTVSVDGGPPFTATPGAVPPEPVALALVVERSAAMGMAGTPHSTRLADAALLATALLERLPAGSQASLVAFDETVKLLAPMGGVAGARAALGALVAAPAGAERDPGAAGEALRLAGTTLGDRAGARVVVAFVAGAGQLGGDDPGGPGLVSGALLALVDLGGAEGAPAAATGLTGVLRVPFHTHDSMELPERFARFQREVVGLVDGAERVGLTVPVAGLAPGPHEVLVGGCGEPARASFSVARAARPGPLVWLPLGALGIAGAGYGLWRWGPRAWRRSAQGETSTARYRPPLEVTTARRETTPGGQAQLCAVVWDGRERRVYPLTSRQCTLGREAGSTIRIEGEWLSGLHARLSLVGEGVEIADLESTNGTFVGEPGRPLQPGVPEALALGESVRLGPEVRLAVYRADDPRVEVPL